MAVFITVLLLVVGFIAYHFFMLRLERKVIYRPFRYAETYQRSMLPGMIEIPYSSTAGKGTAFFLKGKGHGVIVAFNGARRSALDWMDFFNDWNLDQAHPSVLLIDFPMTGHAQGRLNERSIQRHADAAFEEIIQRGLLTPTSPVGVLGFSLGCSPATKWASRHDGQIIKILLLAPMTSLREIAKWKGRRFNCLLRQRLDATEGIRKLLKQNPDTEILIIHDKADNVVPAWMGQKLRDIQPQKIKLILQKEECNEPHDMIHRESVINIAREYFG